MGALQENEGPETWQNLSAYILGWMKKGNCGKGTKTPGEATGGELVQQGPSARHPPWLDSLSLMMGVSSS